MVEFRSKKDNKGKVFTYPINSKKVKLKKPVKKSTRKAISKAKKRVGEIQDMLPVSQLVSSNPHSPNAYISNESAYKQSQDAMAMMKKAMVGSKKIRDQYDYDKMIDDLYREFNA